MIVHCLVAFLLFLAGFFIHAFLSSTRIKMETTRADFWEHKWNELVEVTSVRIGQAKDDAKYEGDKP